MGNENSYSRFTIHPSNDKRSRSSQVPFLDGCRLFKVLVAFLGLIICTAIILDSIKGCLSRRVAEPTWQASLQANPLPSALRFFTPNGLPCSDLHHNSKARSDL